MARKPYYKKKMSANQKASLALKKVKKLEGDEELKNTDNAGNIPNQNNTETRVHITNISQGDTQNQRTGLKVTLKSLQFMFHSTCTFPTFLRVLVVMDKMNTGTAPNLSDVLQGVTVLTPKQIINQSGARYWVMYDKTISQDATGYNQAIYRKKYIKLNTQCHYTSTGASDEREGNIWLFFLSAATASGPTVDWYTRLRFTDD